MNQYNDFELNEMQIPTEVSQSTRSDAEYDYTMDSSLMPNSVTSCRIRRSRNKSTYESPYWLPSENETELIDMIKQLNLRSITESELE